jgi:enediyne biosynthesis protein E4
MKTCLEKPKRIGIRRNPRMATALSAALLWFGASVQAKIFTKVPGLTNPRNADGCGWIDYNNDNLLDAYITHFNTGNFMYANNGDGSFRLVDSGDIIPTGGNYAGISWGDYDNDGYADMYVASMNGTPTLLKNAGNGNFIGIANSAVTRDGGTYLQANWVDYDNDGNLDLFVPTMSGLGFGPGGGTRNLLYRNNGDGTFAKITDSALAVELGNNDCAAFADMDNDGDQDVFMTEWGKDNGLFENNGDGTFTKINGLTVNANNVISISCGWGDYDNDGFMDLFVGNGSTSASVKSRNCLFHNNGDKTFTRVTEGDIVTELGCTWGQAWGDVDNDGDLDLFVDRIYDKESLLYLNNGDGTFAVEHEFAEDTLQVSPSAGADNTGPSFGDYDNDGSLDLLLPHISDGDGFIYHNNGNGNRWIQLTCKGTASNASAIGARIRLKASIFGKAVWQTREIGGTQGLRGGQDLRAHFGLGDAPVVDSLVIQWPSGIQTVQTDVPADQQLTVQEVIPDPYLKPLFSTDALKGKASLTVQFTDKSVTNPKYPVTSWSWDFDTDGREDSKERNPTHTYQNDLGGVYSVSLTVGNGLSSKTTVKKDLIRLFPLLSDNLAFWTKAYASSSESDAYPPENAIDGDAGSRWSSAFKDPQWIMVVMDSIHTIGGVTLDWESAYGRQYEIQVSTDSAAWRTVYSELKGNGGKDSLSFAPVQARYVRLNGSKRGTSYGYSLYEVNIYRAGTTGISESGKQVEGCALDQNYPNPFNPETMIRYRISNPGNVELTVCNAIGQQVRTLLKSWEQSGNHAVCWDGCDDSGKRLPGGIYLCLLKTSETFVLRKMLLLK